MAVLEYCIYLWKKTGDEDLMCINFSCTVPPILKIEKLYFSKNEKGDLLHACYT